MKKLQPLLALAIFLIPAFGWTQGVDFNREVRPILADKCYHCHGPDQQNRKANLRLDTPEGAANVVKAESVEATKVYKRITHANPDKRMPPADANFSKVLTVKEIDILKKPSGITTTKSTMLVNCTAARTSRIRRSRPREKMGASPSVNIEADLHFGDP